MKGGRKMDKHKATIETMINTIAIAFTTFGVAAVTARDLFGFLVIAFGMGLEFLKYYGRSKKYW